MQYLSRKIIRVAENCRISGGLISNAEGFRMSEQWQDAAEAYSEAAEIQIKLDFLQDAALNFYQAGEMMERVDAFGAEKYFKRAISFYCDTEKFHIAGRIARKLAQWNQSVCNFNSSIQQYQRASSFYLAGNCSHESNTCLICAAEIMGTNEIQRYKEASSIFYSIGMNLLNEHLRKFSTNEYFFRCGLLELVAGKSNLVDFRSSMQRMKTSNPMFLFSREYQFLENLALYIQNGNYDDFADHVYYYFNAVQNVSEWCLECLQEIQLMLESESIQEKLES